MGKLHEVVAVADDNRGLFDKLISETRDTLLDRQKHFEGVMRTFESVVDDDKIRDTEIKNLVSTVGAKMKYLEDQMIKIFDAGFQREKTNCVATADIIITNDDGTTQTIATKVPVTFLIQMEKQFTALRNQVYNQIPTLDPTKVWKWDDQRGFYVNEEPRKEITRKVSKVIVKYDATDKHPAQTELVPNDQICAYAKVVNQSGMTTPVKKSDLLARLDKFVHAVKTARCRANETEVITAKIAKDIFNYIGTGDTLKGE